ncbi:hypothetical protein GALMADRAFT_245623, partial [Galerina marginata CBS 339.88]
MPPPTLPFELHALILRFYRPLHFLKWIEGDLRSPTLSPYNAAFVCKLWRDILSEFPECWTRVVFDVAKDPTPFIDVFLWSNARTGIEVLVFNSSEILDIAQESHRSLEYDRVSRVVQALAPHIHRCKSVTIDITYSSCLPSPIIFFRQDLPNIEKLYLTSRADDIAAGNHPWTVIENTDPPLAKSFPKLKTLSLTGFWFMHLVLSAQSPDWFSHSVAQLRSLHVSQFAFLETGHYTIENFVLYLSKFTWRTSTSYHLRDLSLSYAFNNTSVDYREEAPEIENSIHFQSVSPGFISHFYAASSLPELEESTISFTTCQIPRIPRFLAHLTLVLTNIDGRSLRNVLKAWDGLELRICSCPSFKDTFITWLGAEIDHKVEWSELPIKVLRLVRLMSVSVDDCSNFTPSVLCAFVEARNNGAVSSRLCDQPLTMLEVMGRVPALPDQSKAWFLRNAETTTVRWQMVDENGKREIFTYPTYE